ncbi:thioesterase family protein [Saccharothrix obliqua]|uniref:thioesterase family protein n=1 Tax=Saccharothrix obliqua TaxID=2861747 RepID=UPI001C5E7354|nr:thioesterase family protein [Saccharothrix obliqua]MBW4721855.1 thioesterase family protein [Saccharothrix obliqua]
MTATTRAEPTVLRARPAYEGANIRTWVGFKHFDYLVEQAVLQWLRDRGTGARALYLEHGLGAEIVDCSLQLPAVLELDDEVRVEAVEEDAGGGRLSVRIAVEREGAEVTVLRGRVRVALVRERSADRYRPAPAALAALEVAALPEPAGVPLAGRPAAEVLAERPNAFVWSWRAPYYYCHFSDRVQHSGFVRALEEVVDRFLADRGISVGRLLTERSWIPVVSRARVRLLAAAHMEETVHTVFRVVDVLRGTLFDAEMDCYVQRGDELVPVAAGRILHGYAVAAGDGAGGLAELTDDVVRALTGGAA